MNVKYALPALLVAALSAPVFAQTATTDTKAKAAADTKAAVEKKAAADTKAAPDTKSTARIDQRQGNQETRIEQGAKSGELTNKETAKLEKGQAKVQKMEDKAVADGKVTKNEKKHIEHTQDQQSKKIAREKHDNQTAATTTKK